MGTITNNALSVSRSSIPHLLKIRGVYYAFYFDNTDYYIKYRCSIDGGQSWSAPANASLEGDQYGNMGHWSVFYDDIYLYLGYWYWAGSKLCVRRGTPNIPISWDAPVQIVDSSNTMAMIFCKTKNYVWVACTVPSSPYHIYVYNSSDHGSSWTLSLDIASADGSHTKEYPHICSLEQDGTDHLMIIYDNVATTSFCYRTFDGASWSGEGTVGEKPATDFGPSYSDLWVANGELNFVYCNSVSGSEIRLRGWLAGAWSNYTVVDGSTDYQLSLSNGADKLRLFYQRYTNPTAIFYREMDYATHAWSEEKTLIASRPTNMLRVSSEKETVSLTDLCAVTWLEGASAPYTYLSTVLQIAQYGTGSWARQPRKVYQYNRPVPREALLTICEFFHLQTDEIEGSR